MSGSCPLPKAAVIVENAVSVTADRPAFRARPGAPLPTTPLWRPGRGARSRRDGPVGRALGRDGRGVPRSWPRRHRPVRSGQSERRWRSRRPSSVRRNWGGEPELSLGVVRPGVWVPGAPRVVLLDRKVNQFDAAIPIRGVPIRNIETSFVLGVSVFRFRGGGSCGQVAFPAIDEALALVSLQAREPNTELLRGDPERVDEARETVRREGGPLARPGTFLISL